MVGTVEPRKNYAAALALRAALAGARISRCRVAHHRPRGLGRCRSCLARRSQSDSAWLSLAGRRQAGDREGGHLSLHIARRGPGPAAHRGAVRRASRRRARYGGVPRSLGGVGGVHRSYSRGRRRTYHRRISLGRPAGGPRRRPRPRPMRGAGTRSPKPMQRARADFSNASWTIPWARPLRAWRESWRPPPQPAACVGRQCRRADRAGIAGFCGRGDARRAWRQPRALRSVRPLPRTNWMRLMASSMPRFTKATAAFSPASWNSSWLRCGRRPIR